jgi:hypothetical protein
LSQPAFLSLTFIPARSARARQLFTQLEPFGAAFELIAVGDDGSVYRDCQAWIMCLYALRDYRELSFRLAQPPLLPFARQAFALVSKQRRRISRWLNLVSDAELASALAETAPGACELVHQGVVTSNQERQPAG